MSLLSFLKISTNCLCNSSTEYLLEIFSDLITPQDFFYRKIYIPLKQDIPHFSDF